LATEVENSALARRCYPLGLDPRHSLGPPSPRPGRGRAGPKNASPADVTFSPPSVPPGRPGLAFGSPGPGADAPRCSTESTVPAPAAVAAPLRTATGRCPRT